MRGLHSICSALHLPFEYTRACRVLQICLKEYLG